MSNERHLLVVGAHAADFIWRAAGAVALATSRGEKATVISLSYGERGESGELWKEPGQTVENVKRIRHAQAEEAARILGADYICFDLGDYPMEVGREAVERLADIIRDLKPYAILTHTEKDPFNPDHPVACHAVVLARQLSAGAGVASAFETIAPPALYFFEPHQPELCGFVPNTFLDITPVFDKKQQAMAVMASQKYLQTYYTELAERRANHARRISGRKEIRYAEAFQRVVPLVADTL